MDTILVILIVGAALVWAVRRIVNLFSGNPSADCACGCDGCQPSAGKDKGAKSGTVTIQDMRPKNRKN